MFVKNYILSIFFVVITLGKGVDEIKILVNNKNYVLEPDYLHNENGIWYNNNIDEPYTGRLKVYDKNRLNKLAECTFVNGLKTGIFLQYYNEKERVEGIIGLYLNDKKEGNWSWIKPDKDWNYYGINSINYQILITVDYRDGKEYGDVQVHKINIHLYDDLYNIPYDNSSMILRGQYVEGLEAGEWLYYDDLYSDFDLSIQSSIQFSPGLYWTRKQVYDSGELVYTNCREPFKEVDCDDYNIKYNDKKFKFLTERTIVPKKEKEKKITKFFIEDDDGKNVEINIDGFLAHIDKFHNKIGSVHNEKGSSFTVSQKLRNKLYSILNSR